MSREGVGSDGPDDLFAAMDATWPAAEYRRLGAWLLRRGADAGNRTSAATLVAGGEGDPGEAEAGMRAWGQVPLFMVRAGEDDLDAALGRRGYAVRDAVVMLAAPVSALAARDPDPGVVVGAAPLAIMAAIWRAGGVGDARLAVMERVAGPRAYLLGREGDRPVGCAFVAAAGGVAMVHAVEVAPSARRRGVGARLMATAARWAAEAGAERLALAVTRENAGARALYDALGMTEVASYHYRAASG